MRDDKEEYVACAAVYVQDGNVHVHQPFNVETGFVVCGLRHANCFGILRIIGTQHKDSTTVQGFLTSRNRFVDRLEAYQIALRQGQITTAHRLLGNKLDSSDLY